ncbi:hypothetical protein FUAX_48600 (plasmid) [Fulvitalea axinellae]|uniref:RagB/SusD domain-containing protein n=1 Tax=Fulvitalea axinellae TaxID=1182444 RepID=A0AAU9D8Y1_9BACT|nr:hypothetical protein FUAX_48600 [Fulvitalea axinellae]
MRTFTRLWICLLLLGSLGLGSCSDYFDPDQDTILEEDKHWTSNEKVRSAMIGAYAELQDLVEEVVVLGDLRADLLTVTDNYNGDLIEIDEHRIGKNNVYANPRVFYDVILACNDIIANVDKALVDADFTEEIMEVYLAEAKSLRAWTYLQLAQTYKSVPLILDPLTGYGESFEPEMIERTKLLAWLVQEMEAVKDAPKLHWRGDSDDFAWDRFNINRNALLGELHLLTGNYSTASGYFLEAIVTDGGGEDSDFFKCSNRTGGSSWERIWNAVPTTETSAAYAEHVSIVPFKRTGGQSNGFAKLFLYGIAGDYLLKPTAQAISAWEDVHDNDEDFRRERGSVGFSTIGGKLSYFVRKYVMDKDNMSLSSEIVSEAPFCIYRAADLHLMYAEAVNRMNLHDDAMATINTGIPGQPEADGIRKRINLESIDLLEYTGLKDAPHLLNKLEAVEEILLEENAREFAFEGRRWNTLVRFASRSNNPMMLAKRVAQKFTDQAKAQEVYTELINPDNWYLDFNMNFLGKE